VNTVMNLRVPKILGSFWVAAQFAASQEGLSSTKLVSYYTVILLKWNSTHDVNSVTAFTLSSAYPHNLCFGGKATAHHKAIAHVSPNFLGRMDLF
jgi:hypothetical protein